MTWTAAAAIVARAFNVRVAVVLDCRGRASRASGSLLGARRGAIYLAAVGGNLSVRALCRASGMDHRTIEHHLHRVEDDRELRAELDALMDQLTLRLQLGIAELASSLPRSVQESFSGPVTDDLLRWLFVDEGMTLGRIASCTSTSRGEVTRRLAALNLGRAA